MHSCTVSAPVPSCSTPLTSSNKKYTAVELLTRQRLYFVVDVKSKVRDLYGRTCAHLAAQGMLDCDLFGLTFLFDGEYLFADPEIKLSKYAPKNWKASHCHGLGCNGRPSLVLYFRVKFYVDSPLLLRDEVTRHHYYLQLRYNVCNRGTLYAENITKSLYQLAGYALQADLGDYDETTHESHNGAYFTPSNYFPVQMLPTVGQKILQSVPILHQENRGLTQSQAHLQYIQETLSTKKSFPTHNTHIYQLKQKKQELGPGSVWLTICSKGIHLYSGDAALIATFIWPNIGKVCFDVREKVAPIQSSTQIQTAPVTTVVGGNGMIQVLLEQSKNYDLPLIAALCNDRSLIKQTNAFVMPEHPAHGKSSTNTDRQTSDSNPRCSTCRSYASKNDSNEIQISHRKALSSYTLSCSSRVRRLYPVSQPQRKPSGTTHTHPHHDRLKVVQGQNCNNFKNSSKN